MQLVVKHPNISFSFAPTPWDDQLLGGKTGLITLDHYDLGSSLAGDLFKEWVRDNAIVYCGLKIDPENLFIKKAATELGFYFVNSTCEVFKRDLDNLIPAQGNFKISRATEADFREILSNNLKNMVHGRFHEDFNFKNIVNKRQKLILNSQFKDPDVQFSVGQIEQSFVGYSIFRKKKKSVELMHMGVNGDVLQPMHAINYWIEIFNHLKDSLEIKRISGRLTLTNTGAVSIYSKLQFTFHRPLDEYAFTINNME